MFNWKEVYPAGGSDYKWYPTASDDNFNILLAGIFYGGMYKSVNGGLIWHQIYPGGLVSRNWVAVAMSADGQQMLVNAEYNGARAFQSWDGGSHWTEVPSPAGGKDRMWYSASMSANGKYRLMGVNGGPLFVSKDNGYSWQQSLGVSKWFAADVCRGNGKIMIAGIGRLYGKGGRVYRSVDGGGNWTQLFPRGDEDGLYYDVSQSFDGTKIVIVEEGWQKVWLSVNSGQSWSNITPGGVSWPGEFRSCYKGGTVAPLQVFSQECAPGAGRYRCPRRHIQ